MLLLALASCKPGGAPVAPTDPAPPREPVSRQQQQPLADGEPTDAISPGDRRILDGGIAAMEAGDFERARLVFSGVLDRYPGNVEVERLHEEALAGIAEQRDRASALRPHRMTPTAFRRHAVRDASIQQRARPPKLVEVEKRRNEIIDDERWFADNGLRMPEWEVPVPHAGRTGSLPSAIPKTLGETPIVRAIQDEDHAIALYAEDFSGGRFVVVLDETWRVVGAFDFSPWSRSPKDRAADADFTEQRVNWALVREGVLFVATGHNTYAKSSGGLNAFITAIELETGEVLWRSDPLVANARNFLYEDGYIITGYGFTAEPDFMYVLDAKTGETVSKTKVKSGPSYILKKGQQLLVRTYDTNYVFEIR